MTLPAAEFTASNYQACNFCDNTCDTCVTDAISRVTCVCNSCSRVACTNVPSRVLGDEVLTRDQGCDSGSSVTSGDQDKNVAALSQTCVMLQSQVTLLTCSDTCISHNNIINMS